MAWTHLRVRKVVAGKIVRKHRRKIEVRPVDPAEPGDYDRPLLCDMDDADLPPSRGEINQSAEEVLADLEGAHPKCQDEECGVCQHVRRLRYYLNLICEGPRKGRRK